MIQERQQLPELICTALDEILERWALYRVEVPAPGRRIPTYKYTLMRRGTVLEEVAVFELHQLPGCAKVCVSAHSQVNPVWRKKGIGTLLNLSRKRLARLLGYEIMLCTWRSENDPERKILHTNRWKKVFSWEGAVDLNISVVRL